MSKWWCNILFGLKSLFRKLSANSLIEHVSLCFMAFSGRICSKHILLPQNFDLADIKLKYPPEQFGFEKVAFRDPKIHYILDLITEIPARNSDLISEDGFVPIHTPTLRSHMKDYKLYLDYLVTAGVLECDGHFELGVKSKGYRFSSVYDQQKFINQEAIVSNYEEISATELEENEEDSEPITNEKYPYLSAWFDTNKLIVSPDAEKYADHIRALKNGDESHASWDWNRDKNKYKNPNVQYRAVLKNLLKMRAHNYGAHLDNNVHRLHSVLTNIQKDFRNFITYDGQPLVSIDIKNCQPYLSSLLFDERFWANSPKIPLTLDHLPANIRELFRSQQLLDAITQYLSTLNAADVKEYIELVANGRIYERMMEVVNANLDDGQSPIERPDAKNLMFCVLFSSNYGSTKDVTLERLKQRFSSEIYPHVAEFFRIIKQRYKDNPIDKPHRRLSCILQSIESTIVLHQCCKRIWEEGGHAIPIFTIHDSIVTTQKHQDDVYRVMKEELTRFIGQTPSLSIEKWDINELKYKPEERQSA